MSPLGQEREEDNSSPNIPYNANPRDTMGSAILFMTDTEREINRFELFLRGMKEDNLGNPIKVTNPLLSEEGIHEMIGNVLPASRHLIFGKHEKWEIRNLMELANRTICSQLMINRNRWGIRDYTTMDGIHWQSLLIIYGVLNRGLDEGDRRFWKSSIFEVQQRVDGAKSKNDGLINKFFGRGDK